MNIIQIYLDTVLKKFLNYYNLPMSVVDEVSDDISFRLSSLLSIWNEKSKKRVILTIGMEEATFYEPIDAPIEIKAYVVAAIRNSEIENLLSTDEAATKFGLNASPIPDSDVKNLTYESILYFQNVDFEKLSSSFPETIAENNIFSELFNKYPLASKSLQELSIWSNKGISYPQLVLPTEPQREIIDFSTFHEKYADENRMFIESGIEPMFSKELLNQLQNISSEEIPVFYSDSFKSLTRNIEKLFKVIEYVLNIDGVFVTANFIITNGYVSKRKNLVKPMHTNTDFVDNLNNLYGLNKTHQKYIKYIRNYLK